MSFRLFSIMAAALAVPGSAAAAMLEIQSPHVDMGAVVVLSTLEHRFTIRNNGDRTVELERWRAGSGVGEVVGLPPSLAPSETAEFRVRIPLDGSLGGFSRRFAIFTDEPDVDRYRFSLSAFAYSLIEPERPTLTIGDVARGRQKSGAIQLSARESQPLRLLSVIDKPAWTNVEVEGARVEVTVNEKLPPGPNVGKLRLQTNLEAQRAVEIDVVAVGRGGLEISEYAVVFPPADGGSVSRTLRVTHPSADVAKDLTVDLEEGWTSTKQACVPASSHCVDIVVKRPIDFQGRRNGELGFNLGTEERTKVYYSMIGLKPGQHLRELSIDENAAKEPSLDRTLAGISGQDVAPTDTPAAAAAANPGVAPINRSGPAPVRLEWRARHAEQTFGFLVYRSTSRRGPFVRVSSPVVAGPDGKFGFTDTQVEVGMTYYYYLDSIARNGRKDRFSPVMSKTITAE